MNVNYNNLYCDYIGATGTYSISDYIDITSNNLDNKINITSNNLDNKINITSNNLDNKINTTSNFILDRYDKLIKEGTEGILKHTYITNSNIQGEIRFITKFNTNDYRYKTRIKENGEIEVFYPDYNPIYPTMFVGWYNVMGSIRDLYNFQNIAIEITGGLTVAINDIYQKYYGLVAATGASLSKITGAQLTKEQFAQITYAASRNVNYNRFNETQALLGLTALGVAGIAASIFNGVAYDTSVRHILYDLSNLNLSVYSNITQTEKNTALSNLTNDANLNIIETYTNLSNLNINFGFINSNIQTQQYINSLNTNELKINNNNISNIYVASNVLSNLNINQGFINSNITTEQLIPSLKTSLLNLNSGNITNVNNITSLGKIKENNIFLESTYATINYVNTNLFNNSYSQERLYPPKTFNSYTLATTSTEILGRNCFKETITLTSDNITYGSGIYNIYSSSSYGDFNFSVFNIFNFTTNSAGFFGSGNYNYNTGFFNRTDMFLKNNYFGDWVVIKLLSPLILNRFKLYYTNPYSAPALWRLYGSSDGLLFTEIPEGGNFIDALNTNNYSGGFYEKIFDNTKEYLYIGIVINKIIGGNISASYLNFGQFQLYGVNVNNYNNVYTTSNAVKSIVEFDMAIVAKHYGFYITITTPIVINGITFYKYDINLTPYCNKGIIQIGPQSGDTFRSFKIRVMYATMFFSYIINDLPNVCYYEIFMSYKNTASPPNGSAGLNACAIGFPPNPTLQAIMPNNLFVIKNGAGSIDYITVVSSSAADCRVIIEDLIG